VTRAGIERRLAALERGSQPRRHSGTLQIPGHATPAQVDAFVKFLCEQCLEQGMEPPFPFVIMPSTCSIDEWSTIVDRQMEAIYGEF
jgi:hypothetical protein